MDTHIKNGPIDAYRSLFVRLKGARPSHSKGVAAGMQTGLGYRVDYSGVVRGTLAGRPEGCWQDTKGALVGHWWVMSGVMSGAMAARN